MSLAIISDLATAQGVPFVLDEENNCLDFEGEEQWASVAFFGGDYSVFFNGFNGGRRYKTKRFKNASAAFTAAKNWMY